MNKLLLSSVSVMAFVTAATNASELPSTFDNAELKSVAKTHLDMTITLPEINVTDLVKEQALITLNEENQRLLGKGLYVMNDERAVREVAQGE